MPTHRYLTYAYLAAFLAEGCQEEGNGGRNDGTDEADTLSPGV